MPEGLTMEEVMGDADAQEVQQQQQAQQAQEEQVETPPETPPEPPVEQPTTEEQKLVPLKALQEARDENKFIRQQAEMLRSEFERFRADYLQNRQAQQQAQQPQIPDYEDDPLGHLQAKIRQQEEFIRHMAQNDNVRSQAQTEATQMNQFSMVVANEVERFKQTQPDYTDALKYVTNVRTKELEALGINDPLEIQSHLNNSALQLSLVAMRNRINPGKALYEVALRYGYKPQQAQPDLNTVQRGMQQAAQTISTGGTPNAVEPNMQSLLDANSPDDFSKLWNQIFKKQINR